ncbi:protein of unknown function [Streptomyces sp. KY75]|nr:protein of unknown function [Streptomyces sp. KY75]CAD5982798.1 protein of unknown function [Streptomyces sp. KY70]
MARRAQQGPDRVPQLLARLGRRPPQQAVRVVQHRRDLVRCGRPVVAAQVHRPQPQIAQPGQGARPVRRVDQHPYRGARARSRTRARTRTAGRSGEGEGHHHRAVRQPAETSACHAPHSPVRRRVNKDVNKTHLNTIGRRPLEGDGRSCSDLRVYGIIGPRG